MPSFIDVDRSLVSAFGLVDDPDPFDSGWHQHAKHQLLYSAAGNLQLEIVGSWWLLPPQRAAWIRAGVSHQVSAKMPISLRTLYLSPALIEAPTDPCRVFGLTLLAREMILYAMRWDPERDPQDETANLFFKTLALLCQEWMAESRLYHLPTGQSPELRQVIEYAREHLAEPLSLEQVASRVGLSSRSLARRFASETQTSWRQFVHDARLIRAMELLSVQGSGVTMTALAVGFASLGAFSEAFKAYTGETPSDYRKRVSLSADD